MRLRTTPAWPVVVAFVPALLLVCATAGSAGGEGGQGGSPRWVIGSGNEAAILGLAAPAGLMSEIGAGCVLKQVRIDEGTVDFELADCRGTSPATVAIRVGLSYDARASDLPQVSVAPRQPDFRGPPEVRALVADFTARVAERSTPAFWARHALLIRPQYLPPVPEPAPKAVPRPILPSLLGLPAPKAVPRPILPSLLGLAALLLVAFALGLPYLARQRCRRRSWYYVRLATLAVGLAALVPAGVGLSPLRSLLGEEMQRAAERGIASDTTAQILALDVAQVQLTWWLSVGCLLFAGALAGVGAWRSRRHWRRWVAVAWPDAAIVLAVGAWSFAVRFALTEANLLLPAVQRVGLLSGELGFGGAHVLVGSFVPLAEEADLARAVEVLAAFGALGAPLLVLLGRSLGVARAPAGFAGLALASLPCHAALFHSELSGGALITFALAATALIALAVREQRARVPALVAAFAVCAFGIRLGPEAPYAFVPAGALCLLVPRRTWLRALPALALAGLVLAVAVLAGQAEAAASVGLLPDTAATGRDAWIMGLPGLLRSPELMPRWLWLPALFGFWAGSRRARILAGLGLVAAIVAASENGRPDELRGYFDALRYAAAAIPWLALLSGVGFAHLLERALAFARERRGARERAARIVYGAAWLALVVVTVATPLALRDYLGTRYGPSTEAERSRDLLADLPAECRLAVMEPGALEHGVYTASLGAHLKDLLGLPSSGSTVRAIWRTADRLSGGSGAHGEERGGAGASGPARPCWYVLRGAACSCRPLYAVSSAPPDATVCDDLERRFVLKEVRSEEMTWRTPLALASPVSLSREPPWCVATLALYEVAGAR